MGKEHMKKRKEISNKKAAEPIKNQKNADGGLQRLLINENSKN